ncbi:hypothetical protein CAL18_15775 [Bordetella genomosp. 7]|nr:hypothetical protein CAL18_15775 [Bordetella genomosp. 7]
MAMQARAEQGAGLGDLGQGLIDHLDGFLDRSRAFAERAQAARDPQSAQARTEPAQGGPRDLRVERVLDSLNAMFDHSIETQMVVRGATQMAGSVNTLLRGQ